MAEHNGCPSSFGATGETPLSLQQLCYVSLASDLEHFDLDALSLLPLRIRTQLLLRLPVADICFLERTSVMAQVDADTVWEGVCQRFGNSRCSVHTSHKHPPVKVKLDYTLTPLVQKMDSKSEGSPFTWKEHFFVVLCSVLLHGSAVSVKDADFLMGIRASRETYCQRSYILGLQMLFCSSLFTDVRFCSSLPLVLFGKLVPLKRYTAYVSSSSQSPTVFQLMKFVMRWCGMLPKALTIDCMSFALGDAWRGLDLASSNTSLLQSLLSTIREVEFHTNKVDGKFAGQNFVHFLLQTILDAGDDHLESLMLRVSSPPLIPIAGSNPRQDNCIRRLLRSILRESVSLLSDTPSANHTAYSLLMTPVSESPSYQKLKKLDIAVSYKVERSEACVLGDNHFLDIIFNQSHLTSLYLSGWSERSSKPGFYSKLTTLCHLTHKLLNLSLISFSDIDLPSSFIKQFMLAFLSSPSPSQQLSLHSIYMYEDPDKKSVDDLTIPPGWKPLIDLHKVLRLSSTYIPNDFIAWLSTVPGCHLSSLQLSDIQYDPDMIPGGILGALGHCESLVQVESVAVCSHIVDCPCEGLNSMLANPTLRCVELEGANHALLQSLVAGLSQQVSACGLRSLAIRKTQFISMKEFDFSGLISAVFALPQVAKLSLDLDGSCLSDEHFAALCKAWIESGETGRLGKLVLTCHPNPSVSD